MLHLQNVSELRPGGNVNCGVMQLHFFVDLCEQSVAVSACCPWACTYKVRAAFILKCKINHLSYRLVLGYHLEREILSRRKRKRFLEVFLGPKQIVIEQVMEKICHFREEGRGWGLQWSKMRVTTPRGKFVREKAVKAKRWDSTERQHANKSNSGEMSKNKNLKKTKWERWIHFLLMLWATHCSLKTHAFKGQHIASGCHLFVCVFVCCYTKVCEGRPPVFYCSLHVCWCLCVVYWVWGLINAALFSGCRGKPWQHSVLWDNQEE